MQDSNDQPAGQGDGGQESQYAQLGVDAHKTGVKKSFKPVIDNDYPLAFCNIVKDRLNPGYVLTQHMDGDGSKMLQRLLHYHETGDATVFRGAVDDAWSMNTGDIAASGFVDELFLTDVININGISAPKDVIMEQLAIRIAELKQLYIEHGFDVTFFGGETADLPDQVKTVVFDICASSRVHETGLIEGNIEPGDAIFGMASDGQVAWEKEGNSGIMSNGLTMARIKLMHANYVNKHPELMRQEKPFEGRFSIHGMDERLGTMSVSEAIMSPTRQWALVIKRIIDGLRSHDSLHLLHGVVMNTGGGATKVLNIGRNIHYVKKMPIPPPIFQLIKFESGEEWENMFTAFNCGVGIDIIGSDKGGVLQDVLNSVSEWTRVKLFRLGDCHHSESPDNLVTLYTPYGEFAY